MGNQDKKEGGGGDGTITVVLNVDLHCEGCAEKVKKYVKGLEGVERVKADIGGGKLTVVGKVDPSKLRDLLAAKTHKEVDIVSPTKATKTPKKDADDSKKPAAEKDSNESYGKKCKHGVWTVDLKTRLHCDDCIKRIKRMICEVKGVRQVTVVEKEGLVTVKGTMDAKELPEVLERKLNQPVELPPPKKDDGGKKKDDGGDKKDNGGQKEKGGEKETIAGGGGGGGGKDDGKKAEANRSEYYPEYTYRIEMVHAPEMFSDENPNACSVM